VRDVERKSRLVYFLALTFLVGGLARVVALVAVGPPNGFFVAMTGIEVLLPFVIMGMQRRVSAGALAAVAA
jgi:hypothetical protein